MPDRPDALMLFAAGFGARMAPLTRTRPKPLIEVAGRPLIDHALDQAAAVAPERIVANTHHLAGMVEAHLHPRGVITVREEPRILDTGGGLLNALPHLGTGPVFTLNTDAVWTGPSPLATLAEAWRPAEMDALLILIRPESALGHGGGGDFSRDDAGRLGRGGPLIYGGAQIVAPAVLAEVDEQAFSLNRTWDILAARGRLYGVLHPGRWCDVGRPQSIALAEALLEEAADG